MRIRRFLFVPALAAATLALSVAAQAQPARWTDTTRTTAGPAYDDGRASYFDVRRTAYDNGFREGLKQGEKDARKGSQFEYRDEKTFQRADKGYRRTYGDPDRYRQTFRTGYAEGYSDAYRRMSPGYGRNGSYGRNGNGRARGYPNNSRYPDSYPTYPGQSRGGYGQYPGRYGYTPAFDNGVRDGYEKGREDVRDNDRYDPRRHKWYREGDHDYRREYGQREEYKDVYRRGFTEGYDRGYREGRWR
jgi:hypothetical protein